MKTLRDIMRDYNNIFKSKTANEAWINIYEELIKESSSIQESRIGSTYEILHAFITIGNPRERWVCVRTPMINPAFAIAEIVWILNGRNDSKFLNFWNRNLPKYAGSGDEYHGAYGHRLRNNFNIDQLDQAYKTLKNNPDSRQVVLQIWDPNRDLPDNQGQPKSEDIPCNIVSLLKVRDGKLEWQQVMRSNDIILGLPYNFIQFTILQEIMAGWLDLEVGTYNHLSDSLHVYLDKLQGYSISRNIRLNENTDDLRLSKSKSDEIFKQFSDKIDSIIHEGGSEKKLRELAEWNNTPTAYRNLLLIMCTEAARRSENYSLIDEFISKCSNKLFIQIWELWMKRFSM
jgi:thymidylate synthase